MKHFNNPETLEELKKQYHKLSMKHHPDLGGDEETMKEINAEYDRLFDLLKNKHKSASGEFYEKETHETPDEFKDIINALLKLEGLLIELCGSWLWIRGNTKDNKDSLKELGCKYASKKQAWFWTKEEKKSKSKLSLDEIRNLYGSQKIVKDEDEGKLLTA